MAVFSSLPEDLVRQCLLRVPYESHKKLRAVCRSWDAMLSNPKFYADRKIAGTSDQLICLIQSKIEHGLAPNVCIRIYDPVKGTWKSLPNIDGAHGFGIPVSCDCVFVNRKLVLIGGFHLPNMIPTKSLYIYDFVSNRWSRGADMPTLRLSFAYAASSSTRRIYVAGGHDGHGNPFATAEAYDVEEDRWEVLPPMTQERVGCQGAFLEGKFMVLKGHTKDLVLAEINRSAEVFDPSTETWTRLENMWSLRGLCVAAFSSGQLYELNNRWVMKYDHEKNVWNAVASLGHYIPNCALATQWRDWIFVAIKDISYLVHPSTGESIEVTVGEDFIDSVTTLEI